MNEDVFNMEVRKFLKKVGVTSQRENETAVRAAPADAPPAPDAPSQARVTLTLEGLNVSHEIDGDISLG